MGFKLGGVDPSKIMVAGRPASKVILGTGTSAVLAWSAASPIALGAVHWLPFTNSPTEDIGSAPATWGTAGPAAINLGALVDGAVRNPSGSTWTPMGPHAFTGWIKTVDTGNYLTTAISVRASYSAMQMSYNGSTRAAHWVFRRGTTAEQSTYAGTIPAATWTHIAMCMEPVTGTTWRYRAYINASEVLNVTYDAGTQQPAGTVTPSFTGVNTALDDMALYNKALTAADITAMHQRGRQP